MTATQTDADDSTDTHDGMAVAEGDHEQVAEMAVELHSAGKKITLSNSHTSTRLYQDREYDVDHHRDHSTIIDDGGIVADSVNDDTTLRVSEWR